MIEVSYVSTGLLVLFGGVCAILGMELSRWWRKHRDAKDLRDLGNRINELPDEDRAELSAMRARHREAAARIGAEVVQMQNETKQLFKRLWGEQK
jgi:hypothetical protein